MTTHHPEHPTHPSGPASRRITPVEVTPVPETLSQRLKARTASDHAAAERHPLQRAMAAGNIDAELYTSYLGQMLLVHRRLESALRAMLGRGVIERVVTPEQYQEPYLLADLGHFGVDPGAISPGPGVRLLADEIGRAEQAGPWRVLGMHYVVEGSNNGSAYIARAVRRSLGLAEGAGDAYLSPYGDRQRAVWAAFKAALDDAPATEADADAATTGAKAMYAGLCRVFDGLVPGGV